MAGAAAAPTGTSPTSEIISAHSGSMHRDRNIGIRISNTTAGATGTAAIAPQAAPPSTA